MTTFFKALPVSLSLYASQTEYFHYHLKSVEKYRPGLANSFRWDPKTFEIFH